MQTSGVFSEEMAKADVLVDMCSLEVCFDQTNLLTPGRLLNLSNKVKSVKYLILYAALLKKFAHFSSSPEFQVPFHLLTTPRTFSVKKSFKII